MSYLPLIGLKKGFWPIVPLLFGISEYNFTDLFHIKGNILWLRTVTLTFPVCELSALDWIKKCFLPVVLLLCGIFKWNFTDMFHIKSYILWQRTITLTFPVHELCALDWSEKWFLTRSSFTIWNIWMKLHRYVDHQRLHIVTKDLHSYLSSSWVIYPWLIWKNGFWPVVHLLYGISEWNFTDMLNIKGYIFLVRTVTLTFPVHELSALDWSEKWFLPVVHLLYGVSEWNFTDMLTIKGYILWLRTSYHCLSQFCCFLGIIYLTK